MRSRSFLFEIFAISLAAGLLEISYTRIFSFGVYDDFTYLILGIALLAIVTILATLLLLLPFVAIRDVWLAIPARATAGLYFACLGLGFILLEASLVQRFTFFLGYPTYSLSVTLFSLLALGGAGSLLAGRWTGPESRAPSFLRLALAGLVAFHQLALARIPVRTGAA